MIIDARSTSQESKMNCYSSSDEQDMTTIGTGNQEWNKWKTAKELETADSFYTDEYSYTGDGFILDFSLGITSEEFENQISQLF